MRTLRALLLATIVALPAAANAADVQLQVVDRDAQTSPPIAQATDPCRTTGFTENNFNASSTSVSISSGAHASVQGGDCDSSTMTTALQQINVTLIGPPGATTQICYVVGFSAATSAEGPPGNVDATGQVGGNPVTDPGGIFQNGNPIATFQESFVANSADSETQRALFSATVGDMIRLETGANANAALTGAGSADSKENAFAAIYLGACPAERAPAASPWGLLGLAAALGMFGAAMLRRKAA